MRQFTCFDTTGFACLVFSTTSEEDPAPQETGMVVVEGNFPPQLYWLPAGSTVPELRPEPRALPKTLAIGTPLDLTDLPASSVVVLVNEARDELTVDASQPISFADPGNYIVRVTPPFPGQFVWTELEVTS